MPDTCNPEEASHIKVFSVQDSRMSEVNLPGSTVSSEDWLRETWASKWLLDIFGIQYLTTYFVSHLSPPAKDRFFICRECRSTWLGSRGRRLLMSLRLPDP